MAFGGVATGSMKAQLAARHTGTVSDTGSTPMPTATEPKTGKNVEVVATLEVTSVPFDPCDDAGVSWPRHPAVSLHGHIHFLLLINYRS